MTTEPSEAPEDTADRLDDSNTQDFSLAHSSSSSPDEVVMPPLPTVADDSKQFQDLFKHMAQSQNIPIGEVAENQHQLLKILHPASMTKIALPVNDALMEPAEIVWQTPATISPTCKNADRKYYVSNKGMDFLFSHLQPNSLVVDSVNQRGKQPPFKTTPHDKDCKRQDLFGHRVYSSATFQFHTASYAAVLAKYGHDNYQKLNKFLADIPEDKREQFQSIRIEGQLVAQIALQASLDVVDTAMAIVMWKASWLQASGIPRELQVKVEIFPFDRNCSPLRRMMSCTQ
ncbi:hypothetical protein UY3_11313 [Chelonia mydas]|uniref:Uncharacterized protein n=1 Tax=Chelonia mydas TaxID=8469 RepID=M7BTZ6_CHEMY|nr:hypothetical protein UY3_11313 [Chelonia mydas]